jgi:predicted nucleic acid-binding protein
MRYLLDTNFISELRKEDRANRGVLAWGLAHDPMLCALSVITIGEIRSGIENSRLRDLTQAIAIEKWLGEQLVLFSNNILAVTVDIADRWGKLISQTRLPPQDLLLAATALEHDLTVITRNVADFESSGARVYNPWK